MGRWGAGWHCGVVVRRAVTGGGTAGGCFTHFEQLNTQFMHFARLPSFPRKREPGVFRTVPGDRSSCGGHCDTAGKEVVHEAGAEAMQLTEYNAICLQLMLQFR